MFLSPFAMLLRLPVTLTALLSLATIVVATPADVDRLHGVEPRSTGRECGTYVSHDDIGKKEKAFASLVAENEANDREAYIASNFTIPVNFHVIYASKNISGGYVP
jgi:hypothetical protein